MYLLEMDLVKGSRLFFLILLTVASTLEATPTNDHDWAKDYIATMKAISRNFGGSVATPTNTFMNLSHVLKIFKEHPESITEDKGLNEPTIERLVKVAEFHTKNCNRERIVEINELCQLYDSSERFYNLSVYMEYIKKRMDQLCKTAFEQGDLPIKV